MKLLAVGLLLLGLAIFGFCFAYNYSWVSRQNPFFIPRPRGNYAPEKSYDFWVYPGDSELSFNNRTFACKKMLLQIKDLTELFLLKIVRFEFLSKTTNTMNTILR